MIVPSTTNRIATIIMAPEATFPTPRRVGSIRDERQAI